jgi:hypothetical protein
MTSAVRKAAAVADSNASSQGQGLDEALTRSRRPAEAGTLWWLISLVLMAAGLYVLLALHLLIEVVHASALVWAAGFAVPVAFFIGAGLALGAEAGFGLREQVSTIPALLLGSAPLGSRPEQHSATDSSS